MSGDRSYVLDVLVGAAVNITAGAALTGSASGDVAKGQETTVAVILADRAASIVASARLLLADVAGNGGGSKGQNSNEELHFEW